MKKLLKVVFGMCVVMLMSCYVNEKSVYAEELSNEVVKELELTEEQKQQIIRYITEEGELTSQTSVKEFIYVTEDAPDDIMTILNSRNATNEYRTESYSSNALFQTEVLGRKINVITIRVSGEVYIYEDGKIHLYSMRVETDVHVIGTAETEGLDIMNTDGSISMGKAQVTLDTLLYGEYGFVCMVYVMSGNISATGDYVIDVTIGQAW